MVSLFLICRSPRTCWQREGMRCCLYRELIRLLCSAAEQGGLLVGGAPGGDALEGIPHHRVAAHALVDRKVAFEHRALGTEGIDAGLDVRAPSLFKLLRRRRRVVLEKAETGQF